MPSWFSSDHSVEDAKILAENLDIDFQIISIGKMYDAYVKTLEPFFRGLSFNVAEENIQARIRGNLWNICKKFVNRRG